MTRSFDSLVDTMRQHATEFKISSSIALMTVVPSLTAFASEPSSGASSALEGDVWTAITDAFSSLAVTASQVMAIAVVTGCGIIAMTTAAKYAMKKIKGMLSQAA